MCRFKQSSTDDVRSWFPIFKDFWIGSYFNFCTAIVAELWATPLIKHCSQSAPQRQLCTTKQTLVKFNGARPTPMAFMWMWGAHSSCDRVLCIVFSNFVAALTPSTSLGSSKGSPCPSSVTEIVVPHPVLLSQS